MELQNIMEKLGQLEKKIDEIDKKLSKCKQSCTNMDEHIEFVHQTYDALRSPLNYMKSKFDYWNGSTAKSLPNIDKKIDNYNACQL